MNRKKNAAGLFPAHLNCTYILPARKYSDARLQWMREHTHGCWCSAWKLEDGEWFIFRDGAWRKPKRGELRTTRRPHP